MCDKVDKVDFEQDQDEFVFKMYNDTMKLNISQVRQLHEWSRQIIKDQEDMDDDEISGW